jgi:hypothetical protein
MTAEIKTITLCDPTLGTERTIQNNFIYLILINSTLLNVKESTI